MAWMEIIRLRAVADFDRKDALKELSWLSSGVDEPGLDRIALAAEAAGSGDFMVALFWNGDCPGRRKSRLGEMIAETLRPFGLTGHAAWSTLARFAYK